jgi:hypothetical protein
MATFKPLLGLGMTVVLLRIDDASSSGATTAPTSEK